MTDDKYFLCNDMFHPANNFTDPFNSEYLNIYEVVRVDNGIPLFVEDHFERLENSFKIAGKRLHLNMKELKEQIEKLIAANKAEEALIRLVFSFKNKEKADTLFYRVSANFPSEIDYQNGIPALLQYAERMNPSAKIFNPKVREKANELIRDKKIYETILVNAEGKITEGSRSNIFFIKDEKIITAPDGMVLQGITRKKVIGIIKSSGLTLNYMAVDINELENIDSVFITGTTPKVLPVKKINSMAFKTNHTIIEFLMKAYDTLIEKYKKSYR